MHSLARGNECTICAPKRQGFRQDTHLARMTRSEWVVAPKGSPTIKKPMLVSAASINIASTPCKEASKDSALGGKLSLKACCWRCAGIDPRTSAHCYKLSKKEQDKCERRAFDNYAKTLCTYITFVWGNIFQQNINIKNRWRTVNNGMCNITFLHNIFSRPVTPFGVICSNHHWRSHYIHRTGVSASDELIPRAQVPRIVEVSKKKH